MFRLNTNQYQPIGLDVGHDSVKMLQLEVVGNTLSVVAAARMPLPADVRLDPARRLTTASEMIRQMLRRQPFVGNSIVTSLPREMVHIKNLRLPQMPAAEVDAAVQFEAPNVFPFNVEKARIHHLPAGEVRQGADVRQEVIVMAAKDEDVNQYLEFLNAAGVIVASLDVECCALFRSIERFVRRKEDEQQVFVMVDIGWRRSQVVIGRGRDINFVKPIEIGSRQLQDAVARKLGITVDEAQTLRDRLGASDDEGDPAETVGSGRRRDPVRQSVFDATRSIIEELGREIALCLRYYSVAFRGQRPSRLRLVGGEARNAHVLKVLNTVLPIPAEIGQPLVSTDTSRMRPADRQGPMSEWAMAFGLAMRHAKGPFAPRDGSKRESPKAVEVTASGVEVVDPDELMRSMSKSQGLAEPRAASGREVIHA